MHDGEKLNSITHLIGAVAALAGCVVLVVFASMQGDPWKIVSFSVYGTTLFLLYLFSTLYHGLEGNAKKVFRRLDHLAIYLLIAGTYTPFTLVTLNGNWGWSIFGTVWGLALTGMIIEFIPQKKRIVPVIIYLLMGWICLVALKPLLAALPMTGFWWLLTGGLFYTVGIVFYVFDKKVNHFHGVWHLFVLAGSACHYFTVLLYVL
ncbi:MAG: hemolysin III family protein [Gammaproteobacteria bacterium]|nr:hemolysin III family protein [Gammaproteobacteria bacterium]MCW8909231.1 hemolysin III family protein [Gammaproteobacteria bacterium]MCW9055095.1 hemolysin III family protein [Gammaproteobacteria bacterium]